MAPQARVHHDILRLAQGRQAVEQALATVGDEMRQGAVVHYFKVAAHIASIGRRRGMMVSGGEIDTERAAIMLLDEYRGGKLGRLTLEMPEEPGKDMRS